VACYGFKQSSLQTSLQSHALGENRNICSGILALSILFTNFIAMR
jgi:hypothetical protein